MKSQIIEIMNSYLECDINLHTIEEIAEEIHKLYDNQWISVEDLEIIKELRDLMEYVRSGEYTPDYFTCQPINTLIDRLSNPPEKKEE